MLNRFNGLRHQAIIGGNNQDHDIGYRCTALAHLREGFMARCIKERNQRSVLRLHLIGTDMLGNAASFAGDDIGTAQRIEQRRFTVIDMAHHSDDRRTRLSTFRVHRHLRHAQYQHRNPTRD